MSEMTTAEITRWIESYNRTHDRLVEKSYHELGLQNLADDIAEIKEAQRWMQRLVISQLVAFMAALIVYIVGQVGPL